MLHVFMKDISQKIQFAVKTFKAMHKVLVYFYNFFGCVPNAIYLQNKNLHHSSLQALLVGNLICNFASFRR